MTLRQNKVSELLREIASEFLSRESNRKALITVTRVSVSKDLKKATIFISIFPEDHQEEALNFCKRRLGDLRDFVRPKISMRNLPYFDCEIDFGEKNRQDLDRISNAS